MVPFWEQVHIGTKKMPISLFQFNKRLVGIVYLFSNSPQVDLTHICINVTSLLAVLIEIILPSPLRLWSINRPGVIKRTWLHVADYLELKRKKERKILLTKNFNWIAMNCSNELIYLKSRDLILSLYNLFRNLDLDQRKKWMIALIGDVLYYQIYHLKPKHITSSRILHAQHYIHLRTWCCLPVTSIESINFW